MKLRWILWKSAVMMIGIFSEIVGTVQFNVGNVTGELLFIYLELF